MARLLDQIKGHKETISLLLEMRQKKRLHPVLLFIGPSGVGKKKVALGLAQSLVCEKSDSACGTCGPCIRVEKGSSESVSLIAPQGTQIKIEQTRELQNWLSLKQWGHARIAILDDADKLNPQAANSLLKTLEEPPPESYFILISQSLNAVLPTIRSRSQTIRFRSLNPSEIMELTGAPQWAVESSQGQMNRLESLTTPEYDQLRKSWLQVFTSTTDSSNRTWAFTQIKELATDREASLQLLSLWQQFLRDSSFLSVGLSQVIHSDRKQDLTNYGPLPFEQVDYLTKLCAQAERDLNSNVDRTIVLESLWWQTQRSWEGIL